MTIYRGTGTTSNGTAIEDYLASKVERSGDTMTGPLNVPAGAAGTQVPQKGEVDTALALKANIASPTFTGTVGGISGSMISNTPAGGIAAATVQAALNELDTEKAPIASPTFTGTVGGISGTMISNTPAGNIAATTAQAAINELDTEKEAVANKDATGGYAGLTLFKINFKNAANTFTSFFTNSNTAAKTYTFQDRDGTIADLTDIAGITTTTTKLPSITVTQATGALTIAGIAKYLDFRSATLTSGTPSTVNADPADLVIPSGATLGSVTTVSARIIVVEMNNAGTSEYAVANISGGLQMDETNLISTTAIDTASDSANVWYSTTARSSLPYRVVACFDAVNTAGAWGNPTLVQPAGGMSIFGMRPASMVKLNTANGYGSTNTVIRRFTNTETNQGSDITYADSAANGASFTINNNGIYAISYSDSFSAASHIGISVNSSQLTTAIQSITISNQVARGLTQGANTSTTISSTLFLPAGSIVRAHDENITSGAYAAIFTITKVA